LLRRYSAFLDVKYSPIERKARKSKKFVPHKEPKFKIGRFSMFFIIAILTFCLTIAYFVFNIQSSTQLPKVIILQPFYQVFDKEAIVSEIETESDKDIINIIGEVEEVSKVKVNNRDLNVDSLGQFFINDKKLFKGNNIFEIEVTSKLGVKRVIRIIVKYQS